MIDTEKQPDLRPISKNKYELFSDWSYTWQKENITRRINITAGFQHDGASIPRFLWPILGTPDGLIRSAALVHDFLYQHGGKIPEGAYQQLAFQGHWIDDKSVWTRKNCDRIFFRIMRECGVSKIKRRTCYHGVRAFGWLFFKKNLSQV